MKIVINVLVKILFNIISFFSESPNQKESSNEEPPKFSSSQKQINSADEKAFEVGELNAAVEFFSEKIESDPKNVHYLTKRCEALMNLKDFVTAQSDAIATIDVDKHYRKGYILAAKCSIAVDDSQMANKLIQQLEAIQPVTKFELDEEFPELKMFKDLEADISEKFEKKMYQDCLGAVDKLQLMIHVNIDRLRLLKAKCFFHLEEFEKSQELLAAIIKDEPKNIEAAFIFGNCLYHEGDLSGSIMTYEAILKTERDKLVFEQNQKVKTLLEMMQKGRELYQQRKYRKTARTFSKALEIERVNKKVAAALFNNRAMALKKSRFFKSAVEDFNESFELNSEDKSIHEKRAYPLYKIGKYSECIDDCDEAIKLGASKMFEDLKEKAEKKLRKTSGKWSVSSRYKKFSQPSDDRSENTSTMSSILDLYFDSQQEEN